MTMSISPAMVKELREKTGAGMMDCKNALSETNGNMEEALEELRKKGIAKAAKKASRVASEGLIGYCMNTNNTEGVLVEVSCETDFVTKTDDFQNYVSKVTDVIADKKPSDLDELMAISMDDGKTLNDVQTAVVAKIGENLGARRFNHIDVSDAQKLAQYIHPGDKIGVMVVYDDPNKKLDDNTAKDVAMHVAAMHPQYVCKENVPSNVVEKEREIMLAQMGETNKPQEILEKILTGKINKFYSEVCLNDQLFVKDPDGKLSVSRWLKKIDNNIEIKSFTRLQVGEGIEKKAE